MFKNSSKEWHGKHQPTVYYGMGIFWLHCRAVDPSGTKNCTHKFALYLQNHITVRTTKQYSLANVYSGFSSIGNAFYLYRATAKDCSSTPYCAGVCTSRGCSYRLLLSAPCITSKQNNFYMRESQLFPRLWSLIHIAHALKLLVLSLLSGPENHLFYPHNELW